VGEPERAGSERVRDDERQRAAQVVQRLRQREAAASEAATARDPGRRDQDEAPHALRPQRRQLGRDQPAERVAREVDPFVPRLVQPPREPRRELRGPNAPAAAREVDRRDAPQLRKALEQRRPPAPRAGEAVHEDERFAAADDHLARSLHAKRTMPRSRAGGNLGA